MRYGKIQGRLSQDDSVSTDQTRTRVIEILDSTEATKTIYQLFSPIATNDTKYLQLNPNLTKKWTHSRMKTLDSFLTQFTIYIPETYMMRKQGRAHGASIQRRNSGGGNEAPFARISET